MSLSWAGAGREAGWDRRAEPEAGWGGEGREEREGWWSLPAMLTDWYSTPCQTLVVVDKGFIAAIHAAPAPWLRAAAPRGWEAQRDNQLRIAGLEQTSRETAAEDARI